MKYVTFYKECAPDVKVVQLSLEDFLMGLGLDDENQYKLAPAKKKLTIALPYDKVRKGFKVTAEMFDIPKPPSWPTSEIAEHYQTFFIPKKTGGLREINAPDEELSLYLTQLKYYFEYTCLGLTHNAAHAYVKERSTVTCVRQHQNNKSNWFLKLDFHDFFGSHTLDYTMKMLNEIFPWCVLMKNKTYKENLSNALEYAFLNGKLPQGTPLSPTLTNILAVPIDYKIQNLCFSLKAKMVYTRYADDIYISSPYDFDYKTLQSKIKDILKEFNAPFSLNEEKTHYCSRAGRNWILGIMLNKDNVTTIGHKQNQRFRAMINNLCKDSLNQIKWSAEDKMILQGQIAYASSIEADYVSHVIQTYESKYGVSIKKLLKTM